MESIGEVLDAREKTHGRFSDVASCWGGLADVFWDHGVPSQSAVDSRLKYSIDYGLEMIFGKLSRLAVGDTLEVDHWRDLAGYAMLVAREIEKVKNAHAKDS